MASKSPLEDAVAKWNARGQQYNAAGGNLSDLHDVVQQDINNVKRGHSPMNDQMAQAAMSGALGKPIVPDQAPNTKLSALPGNAIGDITGMMSGIFAGIPRLIAHSGNEIIHGHAPDIIRQSWEPFQHGGNSEADKAWAQAHGYEDISQQHELGKFAGALRNIAHDPLFSLLPGVSSAAGLTTSKGRKELERHPFNTLVDVFPALSKAGMLGTFAATGELAKGGGKITQIYKAASDLKTAQHLTEAEIRADPKIGRALNFYDSLIGTKLNPKTKLYEIHSFHPFRGLAKGLPATRKAGEWLAGKTGYFTKEAREVVIRPKTVGERIAFMKAQHEVEKELPWLQHMSKEKRAALETTVMDASFNPENPATWGGFTKEEVTSFKAFTDKLQQIRLSEGRTTMVHLKVMGKDVALEMRAGSESSKKFLSVTKLGNDITDAKKESMRLAKEANAAKDVETKARLTRQSHDLELLVKDKLQPKLDKAQRDLHEAVLKDIPLAEFDATQKFLLEHAPIVAKDLMAHHLLKVDSEETFIKYAMENRGINAYKDLLTEKGKSKAGKAEFQKTMDDLRGFYLELKANGAEPIYLPYVTDDASRSMREAATLGFKPKEIDAIREKLKVKPRNRDALMGLTQGAMEIFNTQASNVYVKSIMDHMTLSQSMVKAYAEKQLESTTRGRNLKATNPQHFDQLVRQSIEKNHRPIREGVGIVSWDDVKPTDRLVQKTTADAINAIFDPREHRLPLSAALDKATGLYKWDVMFGPRHMAHIAFGGTMMMLMRDPGSITQMMEYIHNMHVMKEALPELFAKGTSYGEDDFDHLKAGGTLARFVKTMTKGNTDIAEKAANVWEKIGGENSFLKKAEDAMLEMQRSMVALNVAHGAKNLLDPANSVIREEALKEVNKTLVDVEDMAPWERTTMRQIMPFYAFTKHILKYTFNYPTDHPVAAAVLNRLVNIEQQDLATGLPQTYQFLFAIGKKNAKGEQTTIDFRAFDPFRSAPDLAGLQGFVGGLNPIIQGVMEASGVDPLTASPELYPDLTVDPNTGAITGKRHDVLWNITKDYIPGASLIDHYLGVTARTRSVKKANAEAYHKAGWQAFNMPIAIVTKSLAADRARYEKNKLKVLQGKVAKAQQTGNFAELKDYPVIPYGGTYITPKMLQDKYDAAALTLRRAGVTDAAIKAYMPKAAPIKRKLTLAQLEALLLAQQEGGG